LLKFAPSQRQEYVVSLLVIILYTETDNKQRR
jgi:hypothetical protein